MRVIVGIGRIGSVRLSKVSLVRRSIPSISYMSRQYQSSISYVFQPILMVMQRVSIYPEGYPNGVFVQRQRRT